MKRFICVILVLAFALTGVFAQAETVERKIDTDYLENYIELPFFISSEFYDGLAVFKKDGKNGYIDKNATVVIPAVYDRAYDFYSDGIAMVVQDDKYGFIDKTGAVVIPIIYEYSVWDGSAGSFIDGVKRFKKDGKYGLLDTAGQVVLPFVYDNLGYGFCEDLIEAEIDGKYGYVDRSGQTVIPFQYDNALNFINGIGMVKVGEKWGCIDKTGAVIVPFEYNRIDIQDVFIYGINDEESCYFTLDGTKVSLGEFWKSWVYEGNIYIYKDGKCGVVDSNGAEVFPFIYDFLGVFHDGLAVAGQNGKYGFINRAGEVVIPFIYDNVDSDGFEDELVAVQKDGRCGYIDRQGNVVVPLVYDYVSSREADGLWGVMRDGKAGYVDRDGNEAVPLIYDWIGEVKDGVAIAQRGGEWYVVELVKDITVLLNGEPVSFDQPPIIENDRTLVPVRAIFEALGMKVEWNEAAQLVTAVGEKTIALIVGTDTAYVDDAVYYLDTPAKTVSDRTLVPLRFIAESLGAEVLWEGDTRTVQINQ